MAIEIRPTPILKAASAKRLSHIMFANRRRKVGLTPTPELADLTAAVMAYQEEQKVQRVKK